MAMTSSGISAGAVNGDNGGDGDNGDGAQVVAPGLATACVMLAAVRAARRCMKTKWGLGESDASRQEAMQVARAVVDFAEDYMASRPLRPLCTDDTHSPTPLRGLVTAGVLGVVLQAACASLNRAPLFGQDLNAIGEAHNAFRALQEFVNRYASTFFGAPHEPAHDDGATCRCNPLMTAEAWRQLQVAMG